MLNEKVGTVSECEKSQIQNIFERLNGIEELKYTLDNEKLDTQMRDLISNKIEGELPELIESYNNWWKLMSEKYNWKRIKDKNWTIKFDTNEVFVIQ